MLISWQTGQLNLPDAWIEDKAVAKIKTQRTITGKVVAFLPGLSTVRIQVNTCTYEDALTLKSLAENGTPIVVDDDGYVVRGKIKEVQLRHFVRGVKESAVRQRANIYKGYILLEAEP